MFRYDFKGVGIVDNIKWHLKDLYNGRFFEAFFILRKKNDFWEEVKKDVNKKNSTVRVSELFFEQLNDVKQMEKYSKRLNKLRPIIQHLNKD
jgi:hypothetical protein